MRSRISANGTADTGRFEAGVHLLLVGRDAVESRRVRVESQAGQLRAFVRSRGPHRSAATGTPLQERGYRNVESR